MITAVKHGIPHISRIQTANDYAEYQLILILADEDKDHAFINLYANLGHHTNIQDVVELHPSHSLMLSTLPGDTRYHLLVQL